MKSVVFISGGCGALGQAFAKECAARGWDLFLTDINKEQLTAFSNELVQEYSVNIETFACDLRHESEREELFHSFTKSSIKIWMLINVAGLDYEGQFINRERHELMDIIKINIESTTDIIHFSLDLRDGRKPFYIITVASLAGFYSMPFKATYAASKGFLISLLSALNEELRESGVSNTLLCPAGLKTRPESIAAIEAQGIIGKLTSVEVHKVVKNTIDGALKKKKIIIPGYINRLLLTTNHFLPSLLRTKAIHWRWSKTNHRKPHPKTLFDFAQNRNGQPIVVTETSVTEQI